MVVEVFFFFLPNCQSLKKNHVNAYINWLKYETAGSDTLLAEM